MQLPRVDLHRARHTCGTVAGCCVPSNSVALGLLGSALLCSACVHSAISTTMPHEAAPQSQLARPLSILAFASTSRIDQTRA